MNATAGRTSLLTLAVVVAACSSDPASTSSPAPGQTPPLSTEQTGIATYYDATGGGACSFDPSPGDLDVAAMNAEEYANAGACGACAAVTGPKGQVTVRIVDLCPECKKGHLDLSRQAFAKVADPVAGRVQITWKLVPCAVSGALAYRFKEGSSQWWTAIQVRNHRVPIAKLEWQKSGAAWTEVKRESYNYFVEPAGMGTGAIKLRVTSSIGTTVEDTLPGVRDATVVNGGSQL